ncbi:uncharacterized protein BO87DRAFT_396771 [Aspergillus neoniger CBS 115656]|uniref:Uncharacterized protein n=1 Tax=Aspergillus neoniger (strain CBS 115656) TaxID=1448310 RepID=A0A318YJF8_ASPNB|nr:hypothetical protein BO87DRAFT_396771 [Aspergillus neoniger CBS 115656]PYH34496.1 hypothetical protein BO87DRAFT_396771 [Aspergillus neoniger CBS 115656]
MVGLVKVPSSHIRAVPCISGIRHKPLPKAALWLDGSPLVQVLNGGANSFSDSPLVGGRRRAVTRYEKNYKGLNFGSGQSGRLDRQVPVTEKCASWIVQAQLLQGGRSTSLDGRCCLSSVRTLRRARALFAIRPALAVRRPWDPGSPEEVILDVCAGVRWSSWAPLFSFPTVTGTEIPASQRQADGRNMPPRPLEKQIRLVDCGTGLDPSCTKHGGGGEGEERKRFRNQDLSDLSHGGESGCRAWGSQVLRISTVERMQMGMKKYEEVLHGTRPSPDPRSEGEDRSAAAPHSGAADLPFPKPRCLQNRLATHAHQPQAWRQRLKEHFRSLSSVPGTWDYVRNVGGYGLMHAPSLIPPNQSRAMALPRAATCYTTHGALPDPVRLEGECATLGPLSCTVGIVVP